MPELPEVETVRRGIERLIVDQVIKRVICRVPKLRWALDPGLNERLSGQKIQSVSRRAKYLLLHLEEGFLIIHLGMSGILSVVDAEMKPVKHDHVDIVLSNGQCLRLNDTRRFGAVLYSDSDIEKHPLLKMLGPEPLSNDFNDSYLYQRAKNCKSPVKNFVMNQQVVVGVGNIYASEVLFRCGIHPKRPINEISRTQLGKLVIEVKAVLQEAIEQGGTTIKDFQNAEGKPGYFKQQLRVYGREGEPCVSCYTEITKVKLGGRSTFYCAECQK